MIQLGWRTPFEILEEHQKAPENVACPGKKVNTEKWKLAEGDRHLWVDDSVNLKTQCNRPTYSLWDRSRNPTSANGMWKWELKCHTKKSKKIEIENYRKLMLNYRKLSKMIENESNVVKCRALHQCIHLKWNEWKKKMFFETLWKHMRLWIQSLEAYDSLRCWWWNDRLKLKNENAGYSTRHHFQLSLA